MTQRRCPVGKPVKDPLHCWQRYIAQLYRDVVLLFLLPTYLCVTGPVLLPKLVLLLKLSFVYLQALNATRLSCQLQVTRALNDFGKSEIVASSVRIVL